MYLTPEPYSVRLVTTLVLSHCYMIKWRARGGKLEPKRIRLELQALPCYSIYTILVQAYHPIEYSPDILQWDMILLSDESEIQVDK